MTWYSFLKTTLAAVFSFLQPAALYILLAFSAMFEVQVMTRKVNKSINDQTSLYTFTLHARVPCNLSVDNLPG